MFLRMAALPSPFRRSKIADPAGEPVTFEAQVDIHGTNQWSDFRSFTVNANEATSIVLPSDLDANLDSISYQPRLRCDSHVAPDLRVSKHNQQYGLV